MTDQPDTIEIGNTMYDCGECGFSFLDRVFWTPEGGEEVSFLACRQCGWSEVGYECDIWEEEWFVQMYGE